jgi:hypothetical protein
MENEIFVLEEEEKNKYNKMVYELNENENIDIILRQTNLNSDEAKELLIKNNNNVLEVVKNYYGINDKKKKIQDTIQSKSLNQEIYKQIRNKLYSQVGDIKK